MSRLRTIRRLLLRGAGSVLVFSGLTLYVIHTGPVRRFALGQIQSFLRNHQNVVVVVGDLDYNVLASRFELKQVALKGVRLMDLPAPLAARRIVVMIPAWRLVTGSFETAQIRIDGLAVNWITAIDGRSNWPSFSGAKGGGEPVGPAISITSGELSVQDGRHRLSLHLPLGRSSAVWDPAKHEYRILCGSAGGSLQWNEVRLALDQVQLKSALAKSGFSVESLQLVSGGSRVDVSGALSGSPARIDARANLDLDARHISRAAGSTVPAEGHVRVELSAAGPVDAVLVKAQVSGDRIVVRGTSASDVGADAVFDAATGELQIRSVSAKLFSGQLTGSARMSTGDSRRRSEFTAKLAGVNPAQAARAFGSGTLPAGRAAAAVTGGWPGMNWRLAAVTGIAQFGAATLNFKAAGDPGSIRASIDASLGDGAATHGDIALRLAGRGLSGELSGTVASLARTIGDLERLLDRPAGSLTQPAVDGSAQWSTALEGTLAHPSASVHAGVDGLSIGAWKGADGQVDAHYAPDRIDIRRAHLAWGGQEVEVKGEIGGASPGAPVEMEGTVKGRSLGPLFEALGTAKYVEAAASGSIRVTGTVADPAVATTLDLAGLTALGEQFPRTTVDAGWRNGELKLNSLRAEQSSDSGTPGRIEANGSLEPGTGRYTLNVAGRNFRPAAVRGIFQAEAHGTGTLTDPTLTAQVTGSDVEAGGVKVGELRGELVAKDHRARALVSAPALNVRAISTVVMDGPWPFELALDAQHTNLNTTPPTAFDAAVRGSGSLAEPRLDRMTATVRNLRVATRGQETVSDGPIDIAYADGQLKIEHLALKSGESSLSLSGAMPLVDGGAPGALSFQGRVFLNSLSQLLPDAGDWQTGGTADVSATVTGSIRNWKPAGSIVIHDGHLRSQSIPLGIENVSGRLNIEDGLVRTDQISGKAGTGKLEIDGTLPLRLLSTAFPNPANDAAQPARFSAQIDGVTLSGGNAEQPATATFGLKLTGEASALNADALKASVEFSELGVKAGDSDFHQTAPTRITIADGVARLEDLDAKGAHSSLKASGSIVLKDEYPVQFDVAGQTDLAIFAPLIQPVEAAGPVRLEAHVRGTLAARRTTGFVTLDQATLGLPEPRLQATGVKLNAILEGDQVTIREFSGTLNGGAITGGGELKLAAGKVLDANLFVKGKDIFVEYPAGLKTTSSLDLKLASKEKRLVLGGQIEVQEGYYDADELFKSNRSLSSVSTGTETQAAGGIALDLSLKTKRPLEMNNSLGTLSALAELRVAGTTNEPRLIGSLRLEPDGKLYFGDHTYYIERGTVRFLDAPKITPELDIHAYTRASEYTVNLGLTGELNEVTTTFTSDPPLSRTDVIAVLLTGKTVAENPGVDLRALEGSALAAGALSASLSQKAHRALGVSRVTIQPAAVAAESNPGARITVTQDFTQTMRLLYSMNLSDSNDQIWVVENDLTRRFTTRAVKQKNNTYRGEFRHDVRFGGPSSGAAAVSGPKPRISKLEFTGGGPFSTADLARRFKVKPGQKYNSMKLRKGSERLTKFLMKRGYLESRVHMDREDDGPNIAVTVRIELGPTVEMAYEGAALPGREKKRVRDVWHAGISNQQRPRAAEDNILDYFAEKGYLRAQVTSEAQTEGDHKVVRFHFKPGTRYNGVKIVIEGAAAHRAEDILALLHQRQLKLSVYRDPRRASEAITNYYVERGYLAAKVSKPVHELDAERRTARIVIPVEEGPAFRVGKIEFSGNTALTAEALQSGLPLETGAVFEPARLDPSASAVKLKYGKLGFGDAKIDYELMRHDDSAAVDVAFTIVENQQTSIGAVKVEGNRKTSADFARSQLKVTEGKVANTALIRESSSNLAQTGAYTSADIQLQPPVEAGASDKQVRVADLVVAVSEPKPFRVLYGGLYDSGGGPGFIADFQNHNSIGPGRTLGLRARYDPETEEYRLYVTQPFWRQNRLSTTIATYFTRETEYHQTHPTDKLGVSIQQDLPLRSKWLLSYGYRFEKQKGFVPDPSAPDVYPTVVSVAPLTLTFSRDARDSFLDATRGSFISNGFELAPGFLGSDYPYARYYVQYFKYFPLKKPRPVPFGEEPKPSRLVFATGSRLGLQKGFSESGAVLTDRFYAGGGTTVRGFKQDELGPKLADGTPAGGNAVLVLNEELRYPLFWVFDGVNFIDIGNVFPRLTDFKFSDLRAAYGFGLRIRNPFIVLRFDYGFKFDRRPGESRGAFFFSIGQAF